MVELLDLSAYRKKASIPKRVELIEQALFDLGYITEDMLGITQRLQSVESTSNNMATRVNTLENTDNALVNRVGSLETTSTTVSGKVSTLESTSTNTQQRVATLENKPAPVIPQASTDMPPQVALNSAAGVSTKYAPSDHTHAARVQRKIVTLNASGNATWTFAKPFTAMPSLQYMVFQASGRPIVVEGAAWVMDGANYAGVTIKGYRSQNLPAQQQLTLATLLTGVINGVNALAASLTGFDVFGGGSLNGVSVHMSAGDQM